MTVRRFQMPKAEGPIVDAQGRLSLPWHNYLGGIEKASGRVAATQTTVESTASNAELAAAINALFAALRAADLMEP